MEICINLGECEIKNTLKLDNLDVEIKQRFNVNANIIENLIICDTKDLIKTRALSMESDELVMTYLKDIKRLYLNVIRKIN